MDTHKPLAALRQQELLDRYVGLLLLSRTPDTVEIHREKLTPLLRNWNDTGPEKWTRVMLMAWLSKKMTGAKPSKPRGVGAIS